MGEMPLGVVYDGWPLVYAPNSPAALHLLALLEAHPSQMACMVALPGESFHPLPSQVVQCSMQAENSEMGRLRWEQRILPRLAVEEQANLVHTTGMRTDLLGRLPVLVSPSAYFEAGRPERSGEGRAGLAGRLGDALGLGGAARARAWLWPADLAPPRSETPLKIMPPLTHPLFTAGSSTNLPDGRLAELELPETYVLYHGSGSQAALKRLLDAWSWAAGSLGEYYPLLAAGLDETGRSRLERLAAEYPLEQSVRAFPSLSIESLAALYQGCSAFLYPSPIAAWGDPLRYALSCGKPVIAFEGPEMEAIVGPAAYLVSPSGGSRALGAALISVIVEENLALELAQHALQRAARWQMGAFSDQLVQVYRDSCQ
jgi:hypothetical protein